ncbi:hypothetical protein FV139_11120 [Parahaliea maris]|uniref:Uncharacterized protein n=1 Tax=Parahaliea maris TaxID=2716870 RepID=A0A5C8ZZW2_9GAMM|nr:hypothetical protein [Parahaliea maris]TXS94143.1 hypothetical protein FV139_11120 [Parahaliea maris]
MADPSSPEADSDVPIDTSRMTSVERSFVRMALWQNVLALVGIVVGVIALYAAITESAAVRQQTAASVWPFLQFSIQDHDSAESASFAFQFANVGVGPARVAQLQLLAAGEPIADLEGLIEAAGGGELASLSRNYISYRVVSPGETIEALSTHDAALARKLQQLVANPESAVRFCYCSIFDACWEVDSRVSLHHPAPVPECPDYGEDRFAL